MCGLNLYQIGKKILHCAEVVGISSMIFVLASTSAYAMPKDLNNDKLEFAGLKPIADEELSSMRGGFRFSNGLTLEFALKVQAAVDGNIVHMLDVIGENVKYARPEDFRTVIQVGEDNFADIPNTTKVKVEEGSNYAANEYVDNKDYGNNRRGNRGRNRGNKGYDSKNYDGGQEVEALPQQNYQGSFSQNGKTFSPEAVVSASIPTVSDLQSVVRNAGVNNLPGVLTVIQNTLDNKVIQTLNVLDISVSNLSAYRMQEFTLRLNNPALGGL